MVDTRTVAELQVWELEQKFRDIPRDYFMDAVREYTRQLGEEVTGKDISVMADRRCLRATFEHSQRCRLDREDTRATRRKAIQTEGIKILISLIGGAGSAFGAVWMLLRAKGVLS